MKQNHRIDYLVGDLLCVNGSLLLSLYKSDTFYYISGVYLTILMVVANAVWLLVSYTQESYRWRDRVGFEKELPEIFITIGAFLGFFMVADILLLGVMNPRTFVFFALVTLVTLPLIRFVLKSRYDQQLAPFTYAVIGGVDLLEDINRAFEVAYLGKATFKGFFAESSAQQNDCLGTISDLKQQLAAQSLKIHKLIYVEGTMHEKASENIIELCYRNNIDFELVPGGLSLFPRGTKVSYKHTLPTLHLKPEDLFRLRNKIVKRVFDILFSGAVLVFIFPVLLPIIAILIKLESPGPIFFIQQRSGFMGNAFPCFKFRTMRVNKESDKKQATKDDNRITKIGAFLRKTSLDEFPQFINVFLGHMSVVGPRPHMLSHTEEYSQKINTFMIRHKVKPGITGWAQVNGWRGSTEQLYKMEKRVEHDVWYIENWSFWLDIKIIWLTIFGSKTRENAF